MTKIIAFSGKKQSGKNATANFLFAIEMCALGLTDEAFVDVDGDLRVLAKLEDRSVNEDGLHYAKMDPMTRDLATQIYLAESIWPVIKLYSYSHCLKEMAVGVLGLTDKQVYGSNADKDSITNLKWENMPGVITRKAIDFGWSLTQGYTEEKNTAFSIAADVGENYEGIPELCYHEPGPMTAREVLQYVGTNIFRKMSGDVWADSCIRLINTEQSALAIITDCRFPNEVSSTQNAGGKVIRFTRNPFVDDPDVHSSETALDSDVYDWDNFDAVIDNSEMTVPEQNKAVFELLMEWGVISDTEADVLDTNEKLNA